VAALEEDQPVQDSLEAPEFGKMSDGGKQAKGAMQKPCGCVAECCCTSYAVRVFADHLYLRPRDAEVSYAVEVNSNAQVAPNARTAVPIQTSPIDVLDPDFSMGLRFGFGVCLDDSSEIVTRYTWFESGTSNGIERGPHDIRQIDPMAIHPSVRDAITGTAAAAGRQDVDFDLLDLDYRRYLVEGGPSSLNYVVGLRWGKLQQDFAARYTDDLASAFSDIEVDASTDFEGLGLRLGLEGERYFCRLPVMLYMKGLASLMVGEADAYYRQTVQNNSYYGIDTGWSAGRIVPTFDLELGGGLYRCCKGHVQVSAGYVFSAWTNVVKTEDWVRGVQTNNFDDLGDTITFDGLVARIEARF
jgi:hypothetical protein